MDRTIAKTNPLGTERVGKLILTFAVPSIISMVVNALYNIVDQIFIGQGVGYLGNGATNVVMPMTVIAIALSLLIGDGAAAYLRPCHAVFRAAVRTNHARHAGIDGSKQDSIRNDPSIIHRKGKDIFRGAKQPA